jgi:serine phosphatase RsbU (regulator of sigma subunit)/anti-sigma regulatory factor (Ser/Thr protein kinase)
LGRCLRFRDYYQEAIRGQSYISDLTVGSTSRQAGIYFSGPVEDEFHGIVGVVVVKVEAHALQAILDTMQNASHQHRAFLVDPDGVVILHPEAQRLYHSLDLLSPASLAKIQEQNRFQLPEIASLGMPDLARAMVGAHAPGSIEFTDPADHIEYVLGFAPIAKQSWVVGVYEPAAVFAAPLNGLFQEALGGMAGVGALVALLALWLGRTLSRPLHALAQAACRLEQRDVAADPRNPASAADAEDRAALAQGIADDLAEVADRKDELGHLGRVFSTMARQVLEREENLEGLVHARTQALEERNDQLRSAHQRIAEELRVAQAMQLAILPSAPPRGRCYQLFAQMAPAREVGGDFYDFFHMGKQHLGLVVADVSGKGIPAAFFMAVSRTVLRGVAERGTSPGAVLAEVNDTLCRENPLELFVTVFYGVLDIQSGNFRYANGGHLAPCHLAADGTVRMLPGTGGTALGVMAGLSYRENCVTLVRGDTLFLYTDGITEAFDAAGTEFSEERLVATLREARSLPAQAMARWVLNEVSRFAAGLDQADDLTCLVLGYDGPGRRGELGETMEWDLDNHLAEIPRLAHAVEEYGARLGLPVEAIYHVNLALDELLTNMISYGYPEGADGHIHVALLRTADTLTVDLLDDGLAFDLLQQAPPPDLDGDLEDRPIGGLGIYLVRTLIDETTYRREAGYNHLRLIKRLTAAGTSAPAAMPVS